MDAKENDKQKVKYYSPPEEMVNILSHAFGLAVSLVGLVMLVLKGLRSEGMLPFVSYTVFGLSLVLLYAASTIYHSTQEAGRRSRLRVVDHASIYLLIAGTYTPFSLLTLAGTTGWVIFASVWSLAIAGIVLKIFFTGRYNILSTVMYVLMGWIIIFAVKPLVHSLSPDGLVWLAAGGISYTMGAVLYSIKRIPFNHAIFHLFVLGGSLCHFMAVYFYVLPG